MENKIVGLDDGKQYCILNEVSYNGKKYCCSVEYFEDKEELGDDYIIFEEDMNGGSLILNRVTDKKLEDYLLINIAYLNDKMQ